MFPETITNLASYSFSSFLVESWIQNKALPEAEALLNGYFMAYEQGWDKNDSHMQQDLIWFLCKVMLAWNP